MAALAAVGLTAACDSLRSFSLPGLDAGALLGATGGGDGGDGGDGGGGPSASQLCQLLITARCGPLARCGLLSGDAGLAACQATLASTWCGPSTWPSHVATSALRLDLAVALRCAEALQAATCAEVLSLPADCTSFLFPNAGLNQPCYDGYLECAQGVCRGATCTKSCQLPGAPGEACVLATDCQSGLTCRFAPTSSVSGSCAAPGGPDAGCDATAPCGPSLACAQARCQALPLPGQPCLLGQCAATAFCAADGGGCQGRLDLGTACQASDQCRPELLCLQGACAPAMVGAGAACLRPQRCLLATEVCLGPTDGGQCQPPLASGPCARDEDCQPSLACQVGDGGSRCEVRLPAGAPCLTTRQCQLDAACAGGQCQRRPGPGQPCDGTVACLEGLCRSGSTVDGGAACGPLLGPRLPCTLDAQCASGHCRLGSCLTACTP